jgi:hypothetical protein
MITIYFTSEKISRLKYILRHILEHTLGIEFEITGSREDFLAEKGACINYSCENLNHGLWIRPQGLLSESGCREIDNLDETVWKNLFCFFAQPEGDIPFDLFSAAFYLLTSYEEYHSENLDEHGRFRPEASLAYRRGFLEIPLIDRWTYLLKDELLARYPDLDCEPRQYRFVGTYDIDHPYLYKNKGIKSIALFIRDLLKFDFKTAFKRLATCLFFSPDPYFEAVKKIHKINEDRLLYYFMFILMGERGKYGRSSDFPKSFWEWLRSKVGVEIGLHPSYRAFEDKSLLETEKQELIKNLTKTMDSIVQPPIIFCIRRHFLRYVCPKSFREAAETGFMKDYSTAYATMPGFRSSTAIPYYFYDVENEGEKPRLLICPTTVMDTTLITHLKLAPDAALEKLKHLAGECKTSGGDFVMLWHNSNLAGTEKDNPWLGVFMQALNYAVSLENANFAEK